MCDSDSEKTIQNQIFKSCGVSFGSVIRIIQEASVPVDNVAFSTPWKKKSQKEYKTELDNCVVKI